MEPTNPMTTDKADDVTPLIERLRAMAPDGRSIVCNGRTTRDMSKDITEAADELAALRERIVACETALREVQHSESIDIARHIARAILSTPKQEADNEE